jgi:Ca2+-transporting ATPase
MDHLTPTQLLELVDPKNPELLAKLGGAQGIASRLNSSLDKGLPNDSKVIEQQCEIYGVNKLPEPISKSFVEFVWEALQDKTLIVLMVAAAFEIGIGIYEAFFSESKDKLALVDGGAILVAIIIVVLIGSISDYRKQAQFRALNDFGKSLVLLKVLRGGELIEVNSEQILVGDVIHICTGVVIPADGILISGFNVECDESSMTGEPHSIEKDVKEDPFLLSGTNCVNGEGKMLAIAVGINSLNGRSLLALEVEPEDTPLQQKLGHLADAIARMAFILAVTMVIVLTIVYFIANFAIKQTDRPQGFKIVSDLLHTLILAVTIVVVAVPEGLPLAVTLSLAHATLKMLKDNNLVRHLAACETMGNATAICSDKTGTLTLNKMTVVEFTMMEAVYNRQNPDSLLKDICKDNDDGLRKVVKLLFQSFNVNSSAGEIKNKNGEITFTGSKTEIAILELTKILNFPYQEDRDSSQVLHVTPFSSERKRMSCVVRIPWDKQLFETLGINTIENQPQDFMFVKGASEIVLRACTRILTGDGRIIPLSSEIMAKYEGIISNYADQAYRTICAAIKPIFPGETFKSEKDELLDVEDLVLVGLFGIEDPLRPEVVDAVSRCQTAGVKVRMVTGDGIQTARAIAKGCGILQSDEEIVMEGPEFRKLTEQQMTDIIPKLSVLARSSPLDKQILVKNLKRLGATVAVTGGSFLFI